MGKGSANANQPDWGHNWVCVQIHDVKLSPMITQKVHEDLCLLEILLSFLWFESHHQFADRS